jgi:hypothetical protein
MGEGSDVSDEVLWRRVVNGDGEAFDVLFDRHQARIWATHSRYWASLTWPKTSQPWFFTKPGVGGQMSGWSMIRYCPGSVPPQGPLADSLGPINASGLFSRTAAPDV